HLAFALHRCGDFVACMREAEASLRVPPLNAFQRADALSLLAAARLAQGHTEEALAAAREAKGAEDPPPVWSFMESFIRLVHVEALAAAGEHDAARAALARARERLLAKAAKIGDPAL